MRCSKRIRLACTFDLFSWHSRVWSTQACNALAAVIELHFCSHIMLLGSAKSLGGFQILHLFRAWEQDVIAEILRADVQPPVLQLCRSSLSTAKRLSRVFTLPGETALQQHRSCLQSRGRGLTCTASCNLVPHSWRFCVQTSHWLKALRRVILTKKDRATRASLFSSTESCHCLQHCSS